jgi:hypothetical protein
MLATGNRCSTCTFLCIPQLMFVAQGCPLSSSASEQKYSHASAPQHRSPQSTTVGMRLLCDAGI